MEILFWGAILILTYIYLGYPLLLNILPKNKISKTPLDFYPSITVIIPAFNEEDVIAETIQNKLDQGYPADKINIIVVSDESEDATDEIVTTFQQKYKNVQLIRQVPRKGKTSGLNLAYQVIKTELKSELIVFSDANSIYDKNVLTEIAQTFTDPEVGYVTGKMVYVNSDDSMVGDGCSAYMKYENYMRSLESDIGSVVGVDGGVDAIRAELYTELRADQLPDFVQPLKVVEQRKRVVYQPLAILKEESLTDDGAEFRMRVRVSLRALWALFDMRMLLNPFKFGLFSLQLFSHKVLRYLAFIPLVITFITNVVLLGQHAIFNLALFAQLAFYLSAWLGHNNNEQTNKWIGLAHYFCLINFAAAIASYKFIKGEKIVIWKPRQG
ncbi:glycosyltransferase [Colwellia sp. BRX8-4]|uniref:glycosyltransferase n=1 Tax=Colwellia sp. BRX8-4 TaxID=2759836 RepID=UPI0015F5532D|nr:glycosyltransferase [Colwellia sp. BRX8-4]MBA6363049.1 glycosyltransferase [Colwellia sp. BRX8-8]MBA6372131.1 glycosyltransferase [Colwellia sp. BRX8-4]